eukprot:TRINITY_DN28404_c0_g1_i1.p1 TRINITY_DN28404_c0_g1~~TRINITY_DN28404_c0_g1_i1.p1  ORF type:complete len:240 (-),score=58.63 TRINITY_DN28404_c0_g1_i1:156-875(-)
MRQVGSRADGDGARRVPHRCAILLAAYRAGGLQTSLALSEEHRDPSAAVGVSLVFSTFYLPPEDLASRLDVDINLALATITFRFIIADQIPKVGYSTALGMYCLCSLGFLVLVVVENVAASALRWSAEDEAPVARLFVAGWLAVNVLSVAWAAESIRQRRQYCKLTTRLFGDLAAATAPPPTGLLEEAALAEEVGDGQGGPSPVPSREALEDLEEALLRQARGRNSTSNAERSLPPVFE